MASERTGGWTPDPTVTVVEAPTLVEEVCRQDSHGLMERETISVRLPASGSSAIAALLRNASREGFAGKETTLRRETLPDGFLVGARATEGPNTVWTRVRRRGPAELLVHSHVTTRKRRACVILYYAVRSDAGGARIEETSETRVSHLSGAPVLRASGSFDPFHFVTRYYVRRRRTRDLVELLRGSARPVTVPPSGA